MFLMTGDNSHVLFTLNYRSNTDVANLEGCSGVLVDQNSDSQVKRFK